ncbi:hypothetical protein NMY22_g10537 [Coprinellus aureogranulatus]|nr:hypothetical protein NMY22_g10537 [Coprinellus aureogranulatus]
MPQTPPTGWTQVRPSPLRTTILSTVDKRAIAIRDQKSVKESKPLGALPGEAFPQKKRSLLLLCNQGCPCFDVVHLMNVGSQSITICVLSIPLRAPPRMLQISLIVT